MDQIARQNSLQPSHYFQMMCTSRAHQNCNWNYVCKLSGGHTNFSQGSKLFILIILWATESQDF